jgi:hypothetical protein
VLHREEVQRQAQTGTWSGEKRVIFRVRHKIEGKEFETAVTVRARKGISVESVRSRVARYYETDDVSVVSGVKTERHAEYDYEQLEIVPRKSRRARQAPVEALKGRLRWSRNLPRHQK